jgi:hypothetical protein
MHQARQRGKALTFQALTEGSRAIGNPAVNYLDIPELGGELHRQGRANLSFGVPGGALGLRPACGRTASAR